HAGAAAGGVGLAAAARGGGQRGVRQPRPGDGPAGRAVQALHGLPRGDPRRRGPRLGRGAEPIMFKAIPYKFPDFGSMRAALLDQRSGIDALSAGARVRIQPSRGELPEPEAVALPAGWQAGDAADLKPVPRVRSDGRLLYPGFLRWLGRFGMAFARFPW